MILFFLCFLSYCDNINSIIPFLYSVSNFSLKSLKAIKGSFSKNPIFLGLPRYSKTNINLRSIHFKRLSSPLFYGKFGNIKLDSLYIDETFTDSILHVENINSSDALPVYFSTNISINNCHFKNFIPDTKRNSIIQAYDVNCKINGCSFIYGNSDSMFAVLSYIELSNSNFSKNIATANGGFALFRCEGTITSCFIGNNEAKENGAFEILDCSFTIKNNAIIHNKAKLNSIVYVIKSNATIENNFFVENKLEYERPLSGIVSVSDEKQKTSVSFESCIFSRNQGISNNDFYNEDEYLSVIQIFYWGDEIVPISNCKFDESVDKALLIYEKGSFENRNSIFGNKIETIYDNYFGSEVTERNVFSENFIKSINWIFLIASIVIVLCLIFSIAILLKKVSNGLFMVIS